MTLAADIEARALRHQVRRDLVAMLVRGNNLKTIGQRVILMEHLFRGGEEKAQDLAKRLHMSESRVSRVLKALRDYLL